MTTFTQKCQQTISQREREIGPLWHQRQRQAAEPAESLGSGVYRSGKEHRLSDELVRAISGARETVIVASFLFADSGIENALLDAAKRGVRVYMLLAAEARLDSEQSPDSDFGKQVLAEHKAMLRRLEGWALVRSAAHFHAKAVLVDPNSSGPGFLLTANLATEPLSRNEEIGIRLEAAECASLYAYLRWAMWEESQHDNVAGNGIFAAVKPLGAVKPPTPSGVVCVTTSREQSLGAEALRLIQGARSELIVSSFGWEKDHPVVQALCERARAGLRVRVLSRKRPASMPALLALQEAGAEVVGFKWLHAKAILADGTQGLVMSANIEKHGLDEGFEFGVRVSGGRAQALHALLEAWLGSAPLALVSKARIGDLSGTVHVWKDGALLEVAVPNSTPLDLGEVTAPSAELVGKVGLPKQRFEEKSGSRPISHELQVSWMEKAPFLSKGAKPSGPEDSGAQLFTDAGKTVVAVAEPSALPAALGMKAKHNAVAIVVRPSPTK
jgi:cardiolipin synthase